MSAHTPTPWELGTGNLVVNASDGLPIADCFSLADAKDVIRFANAHDPLVALLSEWCNRFGSNLAPAMTVQLTRETKAALAKVTS